MLLRSRIFGSNWVKPSSTLFLALLAVVTIFLRFPQLGYSHFYGDETKALFLRKDVSAKDFLLNQRKGPVQFVAAWVMEKMSGGFDEGVLRLPFALAGTLAVFALYFLIKELFGFNAAVVASLLFSTNGFFVAFSRTVQYQSFLFLFGFVSIWLCALYVRGARARRAPLLAGSAAALALAFLSHYDAVFFALPLAYFLIRHYLETKSKAVLVEYVLWFAAPFLAITLPFYVPYVVGGYFYEHTFDYIIRRLYSGVYLENSSLYTYSVYNPFSFVGLFFIFAVFQKGYLKEAAPFLLWFGVTFIVFQLSFSNPGTHIMHYIIPLIILSAVGFSNLQGLALKNDKSTKKESTGPRPVGIVLWTFLAFAVFFGFAGSAAAFVPFLNKGYPWIETRIGPITLKKADAPFNLFLYGFPYYRGWEKVRDFNKAHGIRSFFTNDNVTVAEYYLHGIPSMFPAKPDHFPQYFINVSNNQLFRKMTEVKDLPLDKYSLVESFGNVEVYKLINVEDERE